MQSPPTFTQLVVAYLDSMPPKSRVGIRNLMEVVLERWTLGGTDPVLPTSCWTSLDRAYVNGIVHEVVSSRKDVSMSRVHGICKL